jgi:hypothetical protein
MFFFSLFDLVVNQRPALFPGRRFLRAWPADSQSNASWGFVVWGPPFSLDASAGNNDPPRLLLHRPAVVFGLAGAGHSEMSKGMGLWFQNRRARHFLLWPVRHKSDSFYQRRYTSIADLVGECVYQMVDKMVDFR